MRTTSMINSKTDKQMLKSHKQYSNFNLNTEDDIFIAIASWKEKLTRMLPLLRYKLKIKYELCKQ